MDRVLVGDPDCGPEEMSSDVMTMLRALSAREDLWAVVTAVLPIVSGEDEIDPVTLREQYSEVFAGLGMSAESERDLALLSGAVETAKWVTLTAEVARVEPTKFWQQYLAGRHAS